MKSSLRVVVAFALVLASAGLAQAATITFTSSAAFFAALPQGGFTETYESYPANTLIPDGTTLNGITYATFPLGTDGRIDNTFNRFGAQSLAVSRPATPGGDFFFPGDSITLSFATPTLAVGIFFNAGLSPAGSFQIQTPVGTATSAAGYDIPTFYFVGLISDIPFSSALIGSTGAALSGYNLDNLTIAAVPEPATLGLLGAGLAVLVARRRKARNNKKH